jgi:hypothetical protein
VTSQFYDLNVETLEDGTIRLEQRDYCGESAIIDIHPIQAAFIAGGLPDSSIPERIATLERRMLWMRDRFEECYAALPSDMYERCSESLEFYSWIQTSIDVSTEYCADLASKTHQSTEGDTLHQPGVESVQSNIGRNSAPSKSSNAELF